jgi:GT2 family glycosyltransferase
VIVVDGRSNDKTLEIASKFPVKIFCESYRTVGGGRQVGLEKASGEYVAFTDADCMPEKNWLKNLTKAFDEDFAGVGGGIKNVGEGIWGKAIALTANTFLGSANSIQGRLFKEKRIVKSISGCNCIYRRNTLVDAGGFDVRLTINEDTDLNKRLSKIGRPLYVPDALVLHSQGRGLKAFAKRMFQFGYGRGKLRLWDLQCVPPVIALLLALSLAFSQWIAILTVGFYILVLAMIGFRFAIAERNVACLGAIPIVYLIEHGSYILGFWWGILHFTSKTWQT